MASVAGSLFSTKTSNRSHGFLLLVVSCFLGEFLNSVHFEHGPQNISQTGCCHCQHPIKKQKKIPLFADWLFSTTHSFGGIFCGAWLWISINHACFIWSTKSWDELILHTKWSRFSGYCTNVDLRLCRNGSGRQWWRGKAGQKGVWKQRAQDASRAPQTSQGAELCGPGQWATPAHLV